MTGLILLIALAVGYWAWRTRKGQALRIGDVAAVVAALVGLRLLTHGEMAPALAALGGAGWWAWLRQSGRPDTKMSREEARRLLNVPADATTEAIRAAHRRLIARVHPDVGGSAELTQQVNAARDLLLNRRR